MIFTLVWLSKIFIFSETISSSINKEILNKQIPILNHKIDESVHFNFSSEKYNVNCELIFKNDKNETKRGENLLIKYKKKLLKDSQFIFTNHMCPSFRKIRGYDDHPVSEEEINFPIAYSILTYFNTEQFERLLRVIYRSHNIYCIHIDLKSSKEFYDSINSIANCFDNVFITSKLENIVYAGFSRLQADLNCMSDLLDLKYIKLNPTKKVVNWKYLFNLASTEFPLKTNHEIVKILKILNGANDIEVLKNVIKSRISFKWTVNNGSLVKTGIKKDTNPPHNFTLTKGLAYAIFNNKFVDYIINNQYSKDLLKYLEDTFSPDETFWATLQHNTQFFPPGGYKG
jgi:hypothetical protein